LRELDWVEGQNIAFEYRPYEGKVERLPGLVAELVQLKVDLIAVGDTPAALAAKRATTTIPILFVGVGDPVGSGIVSNLARPGGNITGFSASNPDVTGKRLALLGQVVPQMSLVGVLRGRGNPAHLLGEWREIQTAAQTLHVTLLPVDSSPDEFEQAFAVMTKARVQALVIFPGSHVGAASIRRVVDLAATHRLPAIYAEKIYAQEGGLVSYGAEPFDMIRRSASYVDKIFKGVKPGDLPVQEPTKFELVINLKTAKALSLTIPPSLLGRADLVIE
jgi:putative ABC transport system substrate-binding protein